MKQNKLIFTLVLAMLGTSSLWARDVYVYNGAGITPVGTLQNVKRITFTGTGMSVITELDTEQQFAQADFDHFTFYQRTSVTSIDKVAQDGIPGVTFDETNVNILSTKIIGKVSIYNAFGSEVITFAPKANTASHSLTSLPTGVYLVKVTIDDKVFTQKIIK